MRTKSSSEGGPFNLGHACTTPPPILTRIVSTLTAFCATVGWIQVSVIQRSLCLDTVEGKWSLFARLVPITRPLTTPEEFARGSILRIARSSSTSRQYCTCLTSRLLWTPTARLSISNRRCRTRLFRERLVSFSPPLHLTYSVFPLSHLIDCRCTIKPRSESAKRLILLD